MTWWTEKLNHRLMESDDVRQESAGKTPDLLCRVSNVCTREELIDLLFLILNIFAYGYLLLVISVFFFQKYLPQPLIYLATTLSEPYLGALGLYFVLKETMRHRGRHISNKAGEVFFVIWVALFIAASLLTYFSHAFHFDRVYNLIVTDSFAAMIIRIGLFLK